MSIVYLWHYVSKLKPMQIHVRHDLPGRREPCGGATIFFLYLFGITFAVFASRFFPRLPELLSVQNTLRVLVAPLLLALLGGGVFFGAWLILPSAFVLGALQTILVFQFFLRSAEYTELILWTPIVCAAVPVFFFIAYLGLRDSAQMCKALEAAGALAKKELAFSFFLRWASFIALLLCFFFLHG